MAPPGIKDASLGLHPSPSLTLDLELPHLGIMADNHRYHVFTWFYPVQGQGKVGVGICWVAENG